MQIVRNSTYRLIIRLFLILVLLSITLLTFSISKRVLSEINHLKIQNDIITNDISQNKDDINNLLLSFNNFLTTNSIPDKENTINSNQEYVISMDEFKLLSPSIKERINIEEGFTFRAEINENAVNGIAINILDNNRKIIKTIELNDEFFDDGISQEWNSFFIKVNLDVKPITEKGIFQVKDLNSNVVIDIPIFFEF